MRLPNGFVAILAVLAIACFAGPAYAGAYEDTLLAARDDRTDVVIDFIKRGIDINTADESGTTLLMFAANNGNIELLEFLLNNGANILMNNMYGDTAIGIAALRGKLAIVQRLVAAGAKLETEGWAPLHYAAFNGHADVIRYLIDKQVSVDARAPNGQTALMFAAKNDHLEVVRLLVSANADIQARDANGTTALSLAIDAGNTDIAHYLRSRGAMAK
jgi:uncharacterized protein